MTRTPSTILTELIAHEEEKLKSVEMEINILQNSKQIIKDTIDTLRKTINKESTQQ